MTRLQEGQNQKQAVIINSKITEWRVQLNSGFRNAYQYSTFIFFIIIFNEYYTYIKIYGQLESVCASSMYTVANSM